MQRQALGEHMETPRLRVGAGGRARALRSRLAASSGRALGGWAVSRGMAGGGGGAPADCLGASPRAAAHVS